MTNMTIISDNQGAAVQDSCMFFLSDECSLVASLPILTVTRECVKAIVHCYAKRTDHESQLGHIQGQIKYNLSRVVVEMYLPNFNKQTKCVPSILVKLVIPKFTISAILLKKRDCMVKIYLGTSVGIVGNHFKQIGTSQCRNMKSVKTECQLHVQIKVLE